MGRPYYTKESLPHQTRGRLLPRAFPRLFFKQIPQFPKTIQIQTHTHCNAACVFCPYPTASQINEHGRMEWDVFENLAKEIGRFRPEAVKPYLMNEPFIQKDLPKYIACLKKHLHPSTKVMLTSNGSIMREDLAKGVIEAGLDHITFSVQGMDPETYKTSMKKLDLEKTIANVLLFKSVLDKTPGATTNLKVTMVYTNYSASDVDKAKEFWNGNGIDFQVTRYENRGGNMSEDAVEAGLELITKSHCPRPFESAYVLYNGDVTLCCVDWYRTTIMGNAATTSLHEVWNNHLYQTLRRDFLTANLEGHKLCYDCKEATNLEEVQKYPAPAATRA